MLELSAALCHAALCLGDADGRRLVPFFQPSEKMLNRGRRMSCPPPDGNGAFIYSVFVLSVFVLSVFVLSVFVLKGTAMETAGGTK